MLTKYNSRKIFFAEIIVEARRKNSNVPKDKYYAAASAIIMDCKDKYNPEDTHDAIDNLFNLTIKKITGSLTGQQQKQKNESVHTTTGVVIGREEAVVEGRRYKKTQKRTNYTSPNRSNTEITREYQIIREFLDSMRELINAYNRDENRFLRSIHISPDIPQWMFRNACQSYAPGVLYKQTLLLSDYTITSSGSKGFLITNRGEIYAGDGIFSSKQILHCSLNGNMLGLGGGDEIRCNGINLPKFYVGNRRFLTKFVAIVNMLSDIKSH